MELNKEVLDCMKALRRRLREEQDVDIRLSQPNAVGAMLDGSLKSDDEETRRLGQRLVVPENLARVGVQREEVIVRRCQVGAVALNGGR